MGQFETVVQAQQAADEIAHILARVSHWHDQNGSLPLDMRSEPFPIEIEIGEKYGVDWNTHHNWIMPQSNLERAVVAVDNYVLMNTTASTLASPHPFDEMMSKWGGSVRSNAEPYSTPLVVTLQCLAPDHDTAINLRNLLETRLRDKYAVVPWLAYEAGSHNPDEKELHSEAEIALAYHQQRNLILEAINQVTDVDEKERHLQRLNALEAQNRQHWTSNSPVYTHWRLCVDQVGKISLQGMELKIEELWFRSIVSGLPAMLVWLRDQGCSEIRYEIIQLDNRPK